MIIRAFLMISLLILMIVTHLAQDQAQDICGTILPCQQGYKAGVKGAMADISNRINR
jgi:hypothetical protein